MGAVYGFMPLSPARWSWAPSGVLASQVLTYQRVLASLGFLPRTADALDGQEGPQTTAALRAYQASKSIPRTGAFDTATLAALDDTLGELLASGVNLNAMPGSVRTMVATSQPRPRPAAAVGTHPKVATIATPTGTVAVPEKVSTMLPAATVEQLKTMPAAQVQAFVNDLSNKADTAANVETSAGTGKDVAITAVPVIGPDGTVTAGIAAQTVAPGWWDSLSDNQKAGVIAGGTLAGVATLAALWSIATAKRGK